MKKIAQVFAKPFLVERLLRERFDNDDTLHAPQRRIAEATETQASGGIYSIEATAKVAQVLSSPVNPRDPELIPAPDQ